MILTPHSPGCSTLSNSSNAVTRKFRHFQWRKLWKKATIWNLFPCCTTCTRAILVSHCFRRGRSLRLRVIRNRVAILGEKRGRCKLSRLSFLKNANRSHVPIKQDFEAGHCFLEFMEVCKWLRGNSAFAEQYIVVMYLYLPS